MGRNKRSSLLTVLTIGALVVGIVLCVAGGRMVAGKMAGRGQSVAGVTKTPPGAFGSPPPLVGADLVPAQSPPSKPASPATASLSAPGVPPTPAGEAAGSPPQPPGESPTATPEPAASPTGPSQPPAESPTATPDSSSPTATPDSSSPTSAPAATPSATPLVVTPRTRTPGSVTGRVVADGDPVETGVTVKLEDQAYDIVATATTDAQGTYTFESMTPSSLGFNVLFAQEWNEQYEEGEVASWAWLGSFIVESGAAVELPDLEISLLDFEQTAPPSGASSSAAEISPASPLVFAWAPYPGASTYWVDLSQGEEGKELDRVWQSTLVEFTSVPFDGELTGGSHITAATYYWGVGALKDVGDYQLTVYGYLPTLEISP